MSRLLPPTLPAGLRPWRPITLGAAARLQLGGGALHQPPEVGVCASAAELAALGAVPATDLPGRWLLDGWRVQPDFEPTPAALGARGFSVDALGVGAEGVVFDPWGGRADLSAGRVRLVDPGWIAETPVATVQGAALVSELAGAFTPDTAAALAAAGGTVLRAPRPDLREALTRLLVGRRPAAGLQWLLEVGSLGLVLPEVTALVDFHRSSPRPHKDVWDHTLQVVSQAVPRASVRWAALLHDIAKVHTRTVDPDGQVHFLRHEEVGALLVEGIAHRLRFPPELAARVEVLVLHHLRANLYHPGYGDAALRRFDVDLGPALDELLLLSRADVTSKRPGRRRAALRNLHHLSTRLTKLRQQAEAGRPVLPRGLGEALSRALGVPPGPALGRLRARCEAAVRAGHLPPMPTAEACVAWLGGPGGPAATPARPDEQAAAPDHAQVQGSRP